MIRQAIHQLRMKFCHGYRLRRLREEHDWRVARAEHEKQLRQTWNMCGGRMPERARIDMTPLGVLLKADA